MSAVLFRIGFDPLNLGEAHTGLTIDQEEIDITLGNDTSNEANIVLSDPDLKPIHCRLQKFTIAGRPEYYLLDETEDTDLFGIFVKIPELKKFPIRLGQHFLVGDQRFSFSYNNNKYYLHNMSTMEDQEVGANFTIGRGEDMDICIPNDATVSRCHCVAELDRENNHIWFVKDYRKPNVPSFNGVWVQIPNTANYYVGRHEEIKNQSPTFRISNYSYVQFYIGSPLLKSGTAAFQRQPQPIYL